MSEKLEHKVLPVMVGTAGHVDHGKTSLVRHLTGFDTDRLKEEKERGLSIDFGVAPLTLEGLGQVGLIDVPGHEDFIRNMVAGASSIDVLMLVIAADDAVMPQTIEHLRIARLLGMQSLLVVMTKIDLVGEDMYQLVEEDIRDLLKQNGFDDAAIIPVSNLTGAGVPEVKTELIKLIQKTVRDDDQRAFRLYVRHVFSAKGRGTVVTGVPASGSLNVAEELELLPVGKRTGVRAIQNYRAEYQQTAAHISSAINLRDIDQDELSRGMVLASPGIYRATTSVVVYLENRHDKFVFKRKSEVGFFLGTARAVGRVMLLDQEELGPGQGCFARIRFSSPVVVAAGDRFLLRSFSRAGSVGGGRVLSIRVGRARRRDQRVIERLQRAKQAAEQLDVLKSELLAGDSAIVHAELLPTLAQQPLQAARESIAEKVASGIVSSLGPDVWLVSERSNELTEWVKRLLARYHRVHKYSLGMKPGYAAELLGLPASAFKELSAVLTKDPEIVLRHGSLALKSFSPKISAREAKLRDEALKVIESAGEQSIARGNLQQELAMSVAELKLVIKLLTEEELVAVLGNNYISTAVVERCREIALEIFREQELLDLKTFRDRTELSRNLSVAMLEHFDSIGFTKRSGEGRVPVSNEAKAAIRMK